MQRGSLASIRTPRGSGPNGVSSLPPMSSTIFDVAHGLFEYIDKDLERAIDARVGTSARSTFFALRTA